jgi:hypothetical protein
MRGRSCVLRLEFNALPTPICPASAGCLNQARRELVGKRSSAARCRAHAVPVAACTFLLVLLPTQPIPRFVPDHCPQVTPYEPTTRAERFLPTVASGRLQRLARLRQRHHDGLGLQVWQQALQPILTAQAALLVAAVPASARMREGAVCAGGGGMSMGVCATAAGQPRICVNCLAGRAEPAEEAAAAAALTARRGRIGRGR